MKAIILWFLGAFCSFFALGYYYGSQAATDPYRLATYVASRTDVTLTAKSLVMSFRGLGGQTLWTHDLETKNQQFDLLRLAATSLRPKSQSAESELLLKFVGGGALAVTAKDIVQKMRTAKESGNLKVYIASVVGGIVGFGTGYQLGLSSINYESPETLKLLRDKKSVELVKKLIFISMHSKLDGGKLLQDDLDVAIKKCPETTSRTDCILKQAMDKDFSSRSVLRSALLSKGVRQVSSDETTLDGEVFVAFFL